MYSTFLEQDKCYVSDTRSFTLLVHSRHHVMARVLYPERYFLAKFSWIDLTEFRKMSGYIGYKLSRNFGFESLILHYF